MANTTHDVVAVHLASVWVHGGQILDEVEMAKRVWDCSGFFKAGYGDFATFANSSRSLAEWVLLTLWATIMSTGLTGWP
jgi:hypothetical protein